MPYPITSALRCVVILALFGMHASAAPISIKLTTNVLFFGSPQAGTDINYGSEGSQVDADLPGKLITSTTTGQGSFLYVQKSGLAGSGTVLDPLLVTITARSHLDTLSGLPAVNDYQAGIITLTNESTQLPDGREEGLGVRCFRVNGTTALRTFGAQGRPLIEGSKEVSGGTGPTAYVPGDPNGPPHVDEDVLFTFAPGQQPSANSLIVTLSKMEAGDKIDLQVNLVGGGSFSQSFFGPGHGSFSFLPGGSASHNAYNLHFSGLGAFSALDKVESFSIRAVDDNPANPTGSAEHFLITGFTGDVEIPEPGMALCLSGTLLMLRRRG